jgi:subtilase family serine protease
MNLKLRSAARSIPAVFLLLAASLAPAQSATQAGSQAGSQTRSRITAAIDASQRVTLNGTRSARANAAFDQGSVEPGRQLQGMELEFSMSDAQKADLTQLLAAQQDSSSAQYRHWLTPAQFAARFGMADSDLASASAWLQSQGFAVEGPSPNKLSITFSGTVGQAESAFGTQLHYYRGSTDAEAHFAPATDLSIPAALAGTVTTVRHLSNFRVQPHVQQRAPVSVRPDFTSSQTGNHFLTPGDIATVYNLKPAYSAGYNGAGQTIVVIGQTAIVTSDITNFQTAAGVTVKAPTVTLMPNSGVSQIYTSDESESDLDIEYAGGIAPGATINFLYTGNGNYGVFDALKYAIQNNLGQVITLSYGECETSAGTDFTSLDPILMQAAVQGETFVNSSGDDGSTACAGQTGLTTTQQQALNVSYPASSAYAVAVGGTEFPAADTASTNSNYWQTATGSDVIASALSYIPEQVWNDDTASSTLGNSLSAGGGGVSLLSARPSWQTGVSGIPTGFYRLTPDVALAASPSYPGYLYCSSDTSSTGITGSCANGFRDVNNNYLTVAGGTSFAAPIFAGMVAIINQYQNATAGQGLVAPTLYELAANSTTYASAFHDVTSGGNECTVGVPLCGSGNEDLWYTATTGYDEASGLGSVNFYNLMTAWASAKGASSGKTFAVSVTPTTLTIADGSSGTASVTVTPSNGYTGTVAWSITAVNTATKGGLDYSCYTLANTVVSGTSAVSNTLTINTSNSNCQAGAAFGTAVGSVKTGATISASHAPTLPGNQPRRSPLGKLPTGIALAGLLATGFFGRRSRKLRGLVAMAIVGVAGMAITGCSSGTVNTASTGTTTTTTTTITPTVNNATKGTYTLTITGTDTTTSTITANTTLTLTVD